MAITNEALSAAKGISLEQIELLQRTRGATNDTLYGLSEGALKRAIRRLNYPDQPRAREAFRAQTQRGSDGRVPPMALDRALKQARDYRARTSAAPNIAGLPVRTSGRLPRMAGLARNRWEWLGPGNIGGRTRAILIHPKQPQLMWAASVGGGIWHSADGGANWQPMDDFMANLAVSCMVMHPKSPLTMYAGTGEGFGNADALRGAGIFATRDGVVWTQIAATATPEFTHVNRLAISRSGKTLLAATARGLFRSTDAAHATWAHVLSDNVADVKMHPKLSTRAVAGGAGSGMAYYTTNGGKTWKPAQHDGAWSGRVELAYAQKNPNIVYASVQGQHGEIWRSSDGGKTYVRRAAALQGGAPSNYLGDQGWYDNVIWAGDPTDENLVLVGGIDLWRSTDGGETLAEISTWWASDSVHADHHAIVSHPSYDGVSNRTVFFGNDGGVFTAADIRAVGLEAQPPYVAGWRKVSGGYGVTQFYGAAGNAASGKVVAGAQDNGTLCFDPASGPNAWRTIFGGDGGFCAADPTDPNVMYGEYVFLNIHRNTDGGVSDDVTGDRYISGQFWNPAAGDWQWKAVPFRIPDAMNQNALFIAPFVLDPNDPNRLLAGGLSLWRSNNVKAPNTFTSGPSWGAIKPPTGSPISAIAVARGQSDQIWVGHVDGAVFKSSDGTRAAPSWQRMSGLGAQPLSVNRYCTRLCIDPLDPQIVYAAFGGYERGNLWTTRDGGQTWSVLTMSLPAAPVRAIAVHPRRTQFIYVGTEVGVFASEDRGATWSATNEGPANCSVDELFWMSERLLCATHGRGVYQINLSGV